MPADGRRTPQVRYDTDAGPVVRPYALARGRVAPDTSGFDLDAFVVATLPRPGTASGLPPELWAVVAAAWQPVSVAALAATSGMPVGVLRVFLGDLRSAGLISLYEPPAATQPDVDVLEAVVNGLRAL